jgi:hypothetical protein
VAGQEVVLIHLGPVMRSCGWSSLAASWTGVRHERVRTGWTEDNHLDATLGKDLVTGVWADRTALHGRPSLA